jgi:nucleoside-diphosphate-sugar epimerase
MRRLLIVGCGDVGLRTARALRGRWRVYALVRSGERHAQLRDTGIIPVAGDLDDPESLDRLGGIAQDVVHLAPPPGEGIRDARTANLLRALAKGGSLPQRLVYISTSGVYGDCGGALVNETRSVRPASDRARRRVDAECRLRAWGVEHGVPVSILRVPGIYAAERLPLERLRAGTPVLCADEDPYTNHIHADDLARACVAALLRGPTMRAIHVNDDSATRLGDHLDRVADLCGLSRVPRITREQADAQLGAQRMSFLSESRRLDNTRMKRELRVALRYPSVEAALRPPANA